MSPGGGKERSPPWMIDRRWSVLSGVRQGRGHWWRPADGATWGEQPPHAELLAAVIDGQGAIQVRMDVDPSTGIAAALGPWPELQQRAVELQRIVVADRAAMFEATNALEVGRCGAPRRRGVSGRLREAGIVAWEKALEHALRVGERAGVREPEFDHEAVLEGAEETLDPALALGGGGGDPADAEFMQGAADLGGGDGTLELEGAALGRARIAVK